MTLSDIQQSFYSRTFNIEAVEAWLLGLAVVVIAIGAYLAYKSFQHKRVRYAPHGSAVDAKQIQKILAQAFEQRRAFELQVKAESGERRPTLRCAPEYLGKKSLTLEINGLDSLSDKWIGRELSVFFRVQGEEDFTYYTFASRIVGIHQPRAGVCHITLALPAVLENRQKRSFLRLTPPAEYLMGAALWCAEAIPPAAKLHDVTQWSRPSLLFIPNRMEQFHILDVSAGGMRLSVLTDTMREQDLHFAAAEQLLLMLDLFDPQVNKRLRFWMQCRVQNLWLERSTHRVLMGVQFKSWGRPREDAENAGGVEWLRLSSTNEVEPIGNWIMHRHLELFRDMSEDIAAD